MHYVLVIVMIAKCNHFYSYNMPGELALLALDLMNGEVRATNTIYISRLALYYEPRMFI